MTLVIADQIPSLLRKSGSIYSYTPQFSIFHQPSSCFHCFRALQGVLHLAQTIDKSGCVSRAVRGRHTRDRVRAALNAAKRELIDDKASLARLLWPLFDQTPHDPGYIKAYPPGIRENGGQYSHAAAWLGLALAGIGDGDGAHAVFSMINPLLRSDSADKAALYRIEPYAVAGDIASAPPHRGRGGWSWYTGAAAWSWRLAVEGILGLRQAGGVWHVAPALPRDWPGFEATLRRDGHSIALRIDRDPADPDHYILTVDGKVQTDNVVHFSPPAQADEAQLEVPPKPPRRKAP